MSPVPPSDRGKYGSAPTDIQPKMDKKSNSAIFQARERYLSSSPVSAPCLRKLRAGFLIRRLKRQPLPYNAAAQGTAGAKVSQGLNSWSTKVFFQMLYKATG
mmetsp:Transcript_2536/g.3514  ORF Transcript_2536/g.3514 Transcript_2536/m.3514 type:complete len:102 (-) Transcript_2536:9-314(-)